MLDHLGGFIFAVYVLFIGSSAFAIVSAFSFAVSISGEHLKVTQRHLSRAEAQVLSAERSAKRPPDKSDLLVPAAPDRPASVLAKEMDEAESQFPPARRSYLAKGARVAGWARRKEGSHHQRSRISKESTSRIILRSLFAQNELP